MKLEDQVVSLELAKRLKELGVKQESYFFWQINGLWNDNISLRNKGDLGSSYVIDGQDKQQTYAAFTVAELGEIIGCIYDAACFSQRMLEIWICSYAEKDEEGVLIIQHEERQNTEANARAKMLCHLIEKGIVKP